MMLDEQESTIAYNEGVGTTSDKRKTVLDNQVVNKDFIITANFNWWFPPHCWNQQER